jgi:hypothetical protein
MRGKTPCYGFKSTFRHIKQINFNSFFNMSLTHKEQGEARKPLELVSDLFVYHVCTIKIE